MKKILSIFLIVIITTMIYGYGRNNMDSAQINHTSIADTEKPMEELSILPEDGTGIHTEGEADIILKDGINIHSEEKIDIPPEEQSVYEAYLTAIAEDGYLYAYFDYDNDGKQELYLRSSDASGTYGYVMKYADGGLRKISSGDVSQENIDGLEWNEIEIDSSVNTANAEEMTHEGVYAYIAQNPYGEQCLWYMDENSFLSQYGFAESTPFYEYTLPDGSIRLILYYDEQTELGCGIRYFERDPSDMMTSGLCGFTFVGMADETDLWSDGLSVDYAKFESFDGNTGSNYVSAYEENIEYDDAGKVVHFDSSRIYEEGDKEPSYILWMDYEYDDNGLLEHRQYYHNPRIFGTWYQTWDSYFDELGRLEHEYIYITHGWMDYYYIYSDESTQPSYCLFLDDNLGWWMPVFIRF